MARILSYGNYGVYVLRERGGRHHSPHAHIRFNGKNVGSVFLYTLEYFDVSDRLSAGLIAHLAERQDELLTAWEELNRE